LKPGSGACHHSAGGLSACQKPMYRLTVAAMTVAALLPARAMAQCAT
jgi:hypothetical protein